MDEVQLKAIASQLRKPEGDFGKKMGENMNIGNASMNRFAIESLQVAENDQLLEIGMGNGFFVPEILSANDTVKYTGCDFSELMVQEATNFNDEFTTGVRAKFVVNDGIILPLEQGAFDKVFTINTIYFWQQPELILAEIKRVLKPGGQLFICLRPKHLMQHYPFTQYGFNLFAKEEVEALLTVNGFTEIHSLDNAEPPQDFGGKKIETASVVVIGKNN